MYPDSEVQLVEAAQNGHLDSFAALYQQYYNCTVALAYSVLADLQMSEDAAQETFAIVCRELPKLKSKDKFGPWLAGICRNVAKQMQSSKAKAVALNDSEPAENESTKDDHTDIIRRAVWNLRPAERMQKTYGQTRFIRIISIGEPTKHTLTGGLKVPCKRHIEKDGQTTIWEPEHSYVRQVHAQPDRWEIIGGFLGI